MRDVLGSGGGAVRGGTRALWEPGGAGGVGGAPGRGKAAPGVAVIGGRGGGPPHSPLLLGHAAVDGDGWEVLLLQELGQGHAALH